MDDTLRAVVEDTQSALQQLTDQHELLKKTHHRLEVAHHDAVQAAHHANEKREQIENECQQQYLNWNAKLQSQANEFERIQSSMMPAHEVELHKMQARKLAQQIHREEVDALKTQIDSLRTTLSAEKRKYELVSSENEHTKDALKQRQAQQCNLELQLKQARVSKESELARLKETQDEINECLRGVERHNAELRLRIQKLDVEVDDHINMAHNVMLEKDKLVLTHLTKTKNLEGEVEVCRASCSGSESRAQTLTARLTQSENCVTMLEAERDKVRHHNAQLIESLEIAQSQSSAQRSAEKQRLEERMSTLMSARRAVERDLSALQNKYEKSESSIVQIQKQAEISISESSRQHSHQIQHLQSIIDDSLADKQQIQKSMDDIVSQRDALTLDNNEQISTLRTECEALRSALRDKEVQRHTLQAKLEQSITLSTQYSDTIQQLESQGRKMSDEQSAMRERLHALIESERNANDVKDRLDAKLALLNTSLETAQTESEEERTALLHQQQAFDAERSKLHSAVQQWHNQASQRNAQYDRHMQAANKEKCRYKGMVRVLKERVSALLREIAQQNGVNRGHDCINYLQNDLSAVEKDIVSKQTLSEFDNEKLQSLIQQEERSQQHLTHLMSCLQPGTPEANNDEIETTDKS